MKIDEAVELLKDRKFGWHNQDCDCIFCEATNLAIKALEAQRWIPVSEQLPETSGYRLVVNKGYLPYIASYHLSDNEFICDDGVCFPTHWMSLPKQPQEVGEMSRKYQCPDCKKLVDYKWIENHNCKQTNADRIRAMSNDELAKEIKLIANWDRAEKYRAERDPDFYCKWLDTEVE